MTVHSPITDLALFVRSLPDRLARLRRRNEPPGLPVPTLKLAAMRSEPVALAAITHLFLVVNA